MAVDTSTEAPSRSSGGEFNGDRPRPRRGLRRRTTIAAGLATLVAITGGVYVGTRDGGSPQSPPTASGEDNHDDQGGGLTLQSPYEQLTGDAERLAVLAGILGTTPDKMPAPLVNELGDVMWQSLDSKTIVSVQSGPMTGGTRAINDLNRTLEALKDAPVNPMVLLWMTDSAPGSRYAAYENNSDAVMQDGSQARGPVTIFDERSGVSMYISVGEIRDGVLAPFDIKGGATTLAMTFGPSPAD